MAKRVAVILAGGGALGAYEVGALKALAQGLAPGVGPLEASMFLGTSVGAFNATFLAAQGDIPLAEAVTRLESVWLNRIADRGGGNGVYRLRLNPAQFLDPLKIARDPLRFWRRWFHDSAFLTKGALRTIRETKFGRDGLFLSHWISDLDFNNLLSTYPMERMIDEVINFSALKRSPKKLYIATMDWDTTEAIFHTEKTLNQTEGPRVVRAACSVMGIFPFVWIDKRQICDATPVLETPIAPAIDAGIDHIHIIYLWPDTLLSKDGAAFQGTIRKLYRSAILPFGSDLFRQSRDIDHDNRFFIYSEEIRQGLAKGLHEKVVNEFAQRLRERMEMPVQGKVGMNVFRPRRELSYSPRDILNFKIDFIEHLIKRGYEDTRDNKCNTPECYGLKGFTGSLFGHFSSDEQLGMKLAK